jgi:hypothetical protein
MLGTFSYKCGSGHYHDAFVKNTVQEHECPDCGEVAKRVVRHAPKLDWLGIGASKNASPEFIDRWDKMHKDRKAHEERIEKEHGDYGPAAGA